MKCKRLLDLTASVVILALLLSSCSSGVPREMTGRLIRDDPRLFVNSLRWSPDDPRIVYGGIVWDDLGNNYAEVHAVDVQTLSSERIDSLEEAQVTNLQMSPYDEMLFYTLENLRSGEHWLYRYSFATGERELLVDSDVAWRILDPSDERGFVTVSPDGRYLAYAKGSPERNRSYIYDLQGKEERFLAEGSPIAFSPDGNELLLYEGRPEEPRGYLHLWSLVAASGGEARAFAS